MRKPANFEAVKTGGFVPIVPGGHHLIIKHILETQSQKSGKDMIVVSFDMAPNDSQAGYFQKEYAADTKPDKKWPFKGRSYITLDDDNGNCSKSYKTFITAVEDSNPGFKVNWDADYSQFRGKKIGGVFGEAEYEKRDGSIGKTVELRRFRSDVSVTDETAPALKQLRNRQTTTGTSDGFMNIPDNVDGDDLPFV